jgi:hypothetical protein
VVSDRQAPSAERSARLSTTTLMIATVLLLLALAGATIAAWVITRQPPEQPLQVPSVSQAHVF